MCIGVYRGDHVPRRAADGTGRDGYIHFNNGGLYANYKPSAFGNELRGYDPIQRPRFGKDRPEFDDYQHWYDQKGSNSKMEQSRLVNRLVDRLNPTSKGCAERIEKDKVLHSIVTDLQRKDGTPDSPEKKIVDLPMKFNESMLKQNSKTVDRSPSP